MTLEDTKVYLLSKPETSESFPFGVDTHVFKIKDKVFAILFDNEDGGGINLKCDPDQAQALRDIFDGVRPGYHMNKKHWNTVNLDSDVPEGEFKRLIDHSYSLVFNKLSVTYKKYLQTHFTHEQLHGEKQQNAK